MKHHREVILCTRQTLLGRQAYQRRADSGLSSTPRPRSYRAPRLHCALATACSAAWRKYSAARTSSGITPRPCKYSTPMLNCAVAWPFSAARCTNQSHARIRLAAFAALQSHGHGKLRLYLTALSRLTIPLVGLGLRTELSPRGFRRHTRRPNNTVPRCAPPRGQPEHKRPFRHSSARHRLPPNVGQDCTARAHPCCAAAPYQRMASAGSGVVPRASIRRRARLFWAVTWPCSAAFRYQRLAAPSS